MLINIQFLRFVAATLVVIYHASFHVLEAGAEQGFFFATGEALGFAGVDVFFLISGFIMFYTTEQSQGAAAAVEFCKRRLARIFSGYWPFFLLALAVFSWARPDYVRGVNLIGSFFLWPMPLPRLLLDVSWTLIYEMYFYLLFTLLVLVGVRLRWRLLLATFLGIAVWNLYRHLVLQEFSVELLVYQDFAGLFLTSPFLLEFFAGACLATLPRRLHSRWGWPLLLAGSALFLAAGGVNEWVYDGGIEQGYYVVPRVALFGIPSALILVGLVRLELSGVVAPRRFSLDTGGASYAIYLCHTIFLVATQKLGLNAALEAYPDWVVLCLYAIYCALIVAFGAGWYRWAERPLHRLFKRALRVRRGAAVATTAAAG
jgi:exopolysaccharide production protein ExoZ